MELSRTPPSPTRDPSVDLRARWALARVAALRGVVPEADPDLDEVELLSLAAGQDPEVALRRVFENSRTLGSGFSRHYRVDLTLIDLAQLLPTLGAPCHRVGFVREDGEPVSRATCPPCSLAPQTPGLCAFWREATAGLVSGLSSGCCYTRVASLAGGNEQCVDLLHLDAQTPARWDPIGPELQAAIDAARRLLARLDPQAEVSFLGLIEGELYYQLRPSGTHCSAPAQGQAGGFDPATVLTTSIRRRFPSLSLRDASPRAVFPANP